MINSEILKSQEYIKLLHALRVAWADGMGLREIDAIVALVRAIHHSKETHEIMLEAAAKIQSLIYNSTGEQKDG
jgi:hypothetical protein